MATTPIDTLLQVEYLQDELYTRALAAPELLPDGSPERAAVALMQSHQAGHIARLQGAGGTLVRPDAAAVDLTGGGGSGAGPFPDALADAAVFLQLAQLLEDMGVRAYLGQVGALAGDAGALPLVAQLLAAESRHAAMVRRLRESVGGADVKPWVTGVYAGFDYSSEPPSDGAESQESVAALVYGALTDPPGASAGEDNYVHGTLTLDVFDEANTEAFDEPMSPAQIDAVLALFLP